MVNRRKYTEEQNAFLAEVIPGHFTSEVIDLFKERFGVRLTEGQVSYAKVRLGVLSGVTDHRLKPGTSIGLETRFAVGNVPKQGKRFKVGDERTDKDGYVWVKVCESGRDNPKVTHSAKKCWRPKHHIVWEEAHGTPVPDGHAVIFANRDKTDFTPENVVAVPRGILSTMNALQLDYYDAESLRAAMALAKVRMALKSKRKAIKEHK